MSERKRSGARVKQILQESGSDRKKEARERAKTEEGQAFLRKEEVVQQESRQASQLASNQTRAKNRPKATPTVTVYYRAQARIRTALEVASEEENRTITGILDEAAEEWLKRKGYL